MNQAAQVQDHALKPGSVVNQRFEIKANIGFGGSADVHAAFDRDQRREVALKVLHPDLSEEDEYRRRFDLEKEVGQQLSKNSNLVRLLGSGQIEDGRPYLVFELLKGCTLATRLAPGQRFPPHIVASLVCEVAKALVAMHDLRFVHRDVKPENIFLELSQGKERVKLLDFGAAKIRRAGAALTAVGTTIGTAQYMSPEQALGRGNEISGLSDQFSLAIVAYEMLTGALPFPGRNELEIVQGILKNPPRRFAEIDGTLPEGIESVLLRALSKPPSERYPNIIAFSTALREGLDSSAARNDGASAPAFTAFTPTGTGRRTRIVRRVPLILGLLFLSAGLLGFALAVQLLLGKPVKKK